MLLLGKVGGGENCESLKSTCSHVSITSQEPESVLRWFQSSHPRYKILRKKKCSPSHEVLTPWSRVVPQFCSAASCYWMKSIIPGWSCQSRHDLAPYFKKFLKEKGKELRFLINFRKSVCILLVYLLLEFNYFEDLLDLLSYEHWVLLQKRKKKCIFVQNYKFKILKPLNQDFFYTYRINQCTAILASFQPLGNIMQLLKLVQFVAKCHCLFISLSFSWLNVWRKQPFRRDPGDTQVQYPASLQESKDPLQLCKNVFFFI